MFRSFKLFTLFFAAFFFSCSSRSKLVVIESGISNLTQLTTDRSTEFFPSWSKDGNKIAFSSNRSGFWELWVIPVQGGGIRQVTNGAVDIAPSFSPDGDEIVFQSGRITGQWNIWKVSLSSRGLTQMTNSTKPCLTPKWSPVGAQIAYTAKDKDDVNYVWVMGADGQNPTQLAPGEEPDWSPDGKRLVFSRWTSKNYDLWIINGDGTGLEQLTRTREKHEFSPAWSADGKSIAYVAQFEKDYFVNIDKAKIETTKGTRSEIWIIDALGRNETQLTGFKGLNHSPDWAPDGRIAFVSNRGESWDIWSMRPVAR